MENRKPLIAIVGSARPTTTDDKGREYPATVAGNRVDDALAACVELGKALAQNHCHIAVYSADSRFIEAKIIEGYISGAAPDEESIVCISPRSANEKFGSLVGNQKLLKPQDHPGDDWEVSFYSSLWEIDGMLIIGGGSSTLAAGYLAISMGLPVVTIAEFGGSAEKVWEYIPLLKTTPLITENHLQHMARWTSNSADLCIKDLLEQYASGNKNKKVEEEATKKLEQKADLWDKHVADDNDSARRGKAAFVFFSIFVALLIVGIIVSGPKELFSLFFVLGLTIAGSTGATIRMLTPGSPKATNRNVPVIGAAVGLVFSLLYLIPQLIGNTSFLNPIGDLLPQLSTVRVQYISAMVFAFLAGLGFDFALEQLLQKARQSGAQVAPLGNASNSQD